MYKVDCSIHTTRIDKGISSILGLDYFRFSVGCRRCLGAEAQCRTLFLFYFIYITNFACSGAFHSVVIFKSITQSFFELNKIAFQVSICIYAQQISINNVKWGTERPLSGNCASI
jgi:hypothetical protein